MNTIYFTTTIIFLNTFIMNAQNTRSSEHAKAVANDKYTFVESITNNSYASSFTFKSINKEKVQSILNKYFDGSKNSTKAMTWGNMKNEANNGDVFFIELKNKELKIEWKNNISHKNYINELKKISQNVVEVIK